MKRQVGYGIDGEVLFRTSVSHTNHTLFPGLVGAATPDRATLDSTSAVYDSLHRVIQLTYFANQQPYFISHTEYNATGDVCRIIKDYCTLPFPFSDTNTFEYSDVDDQGNWLTATVEYSGPLKTQHFSYTVHRQITYDGESSKTPLKNRLQEFQQCHNTASDTYEVGLGRIARVSIPQYMVDDEEGKSTIESICSLPVIYLLNAQNTADAYATFQVSIYPTQSAPEFEKLARWELQFDKEVDEELKSQFVSIAEPGGVFLLKWIPYRFTNIGGQRALCQSYYRYGKSSPIPVYCEDYTLATPGGEYMVVSFSYQANHACEFATDFQQAIHSIFFR